MISDMYESINDKPREKIAIMSFPSSDVQSNKYRTELITNSDVSVMYIPRIDRLSSLVTNPFGAVEFVDFVMILFFVCSRMEKTTTPNAKRFSSATMINKLGKEFKTHLNNIKKMVKSIKIKLCVFIFYLSNVASTC